MHWGRSSKHLTSVQIFVFPILFVTCLYLKTDVPLLVALKLFVGLVSGVYILGKIACDWAWDPHNTVTIVQAIVAGFMIQLANSIVFLSIDALLSGAIPMLFHHTIALATVLEFIILLRKSPHISLGTLLPRNLLGKQTGAFLISFIVGVVFLAISPEAMKPDAALFSDIARHISTNGVIGSSVINDGFPDPLTNVKGLTPHIGTALVFALYFTLGNPSLTVVRLSSVIAAALVSGMLAMYLDDSKTSFVLFIAIVSLNPIFIFYSYSVFGPEVNSLLITIVSLILMKELLGETGNLPQERVMFLWGCVGVLAAFETIMWSGNQVPLLIGVGILFITSEIRVRETKGILWTFILAFPVLVGIAILPKISANLSIWFFLVAGLIGSLIVLSKLGVPNSKELLALVSGFYCVKQLTYIRSYIDPLFFAAGPSESIGTSIFLDFLPTTDGIALALIFFLGYLGPAVIALVILSVSRFTPQNSPIYALTCGLVVFQFLGRPTYSIIESRFYLSMIVMFGLLLILLLTDIVGRESERVIKRAINERESLSIHKKLTAAFLLALFLVVWISPYPTEYTNGLEDNQKLSFTGNGWDSMRQWIDNNTNSSDVFLCTASARLWTWYLQRVVVGLTVFEDGSAVPRANITYMHVAELLRIYSISHVIVDRSYQSYWIYYPQLWQLMGILEVGGSVSFSAAEGVYNLTCVATVDSTVTELGVYLFKIRLIE